MLQVKTLKTVGHDANCLIMQIYQKWNICQNNYGIYNFLKFLSNTK